MRAALARRLREWRDCLRCAQPQRKLAAASLWPCAGGPWRHSTGDARGPAAAAVQRQASPPAPVRLYAQKGRGGAPSRRGTTALSCVELQPPWPCVCSWRRSLVLHCRGRGPSRIANAVPPRPSRAGPQRCSRQLPRRRRTAEAITPLSQAPRQRGPHGHCCMVRRRARSYLSRMPRQRSHSAVGTAVSSFLLSWLLAGQLSASVALARRRRAPCQAKRGSSKVVVSRPQKAE